MIPQSVRLMSFGKETRLGLGMPKIPVFLKLKEMKLYKWSWLNEHSNEWFAKCLCWISSIVIYFIHFKIEKQLQVSHWNRCFQIIITSNMNKVAKRPCRGVSLTYNYTRAHRRTYIHTNTQNQTRWYTHLVSRFPIGLCLIHYLEGTMSLKVEVERVVYCMLK